MSNNSPHILVNKSYLDHVLSEISTLRDRFAVMEEARDAEMLKVANRDAQIAELRGKLEQVQRDLAQTLSDAEEDSVRLHADKMKLFDVNIALERKLADMDRDRRYHMDAINRLASFLALSGTSFEVVQAAIDNMTRMVAKIAELRTKLEEAEGKVYVPGLWHCAKCKLDLIATTLSNQGHFANKNPQACPNLCGPMWRVTERDQRQEAQRLLNREWDSRQEAERKLANVEAECITHKAVRDGLLEIFPESYWGAIPGEVRELHSKLAEAQNDVDAIRRSSQAVIERLNTEKAEAILAAAGTKERPDV